MAGKGYGRRRKKPEFYRKVILEWPNGRRRIAWENPPVTFDKLAAHDYLDTADLELYFDVSSRTVYRWIKEFGLDLD